MVRDHVPHRLRGRLPRGAGRIARGLAAFDKSGLDSLVVYLMVGMLAGARLTYALAYELGHYLNAPLDLLKIWRGGLSFHGAVIGMMLASAIFARARHVPFWSVADTLALAGTPGLFFGRIGAEALEHAMLWLT